jgi:sporulation protein YlmC with PRC-barrel domain
MRKVVVLMIASSVLALLFAGGAIAQQRGMSSSDNQMLINADKLKGSDVVNPQGDKLGTVQNLALDLTNGKISYVVVDPGFGKNLVPVPYGMFGLMKNEKLVLNLDKARLAQAPGFGRYSQPNWSDSNFDQQVAGFWGMEPTGVMTGRATEGRGAQPTPMGSQSR